MELYCIAFLFSLHKESTFHRRKVVNIYSIRSQYMYRLSKRFQVTVKLIDDFDQMRKFSILGTVIAV